MDKEGFKNQIIKQQSDKLLEQREEIDLLKKYIDALEKTVDSLLDDHGDPYGEV